MATDGGDVLARGLEAVGAHQRAATRAAAHHPATAEAVHRLFASGLRRVYAAHQQGGAQVAEQIALATAPELKAALERGVDENRSQIERLERVFRFASFAVEATPDPAMQGIIDDARAAAAEAEPGVARDQALIAVSQLAAHYYLARYGTLRSYARTLDNGDAAKLLDETLDETARADAAFTTLAEHLLVVQS